VKRGWWYYYLYMAQAHRGLRGNNGTPPSHLHYGVRMTQTQQRTVTPGQGLAMIVVWLLMAYVVDAEWYTVFGTVAAVWWAMTQSWAAWWGREKRTVLKWAARILVGGVLLVAGLVLRNAYEAAQRRQQQEAARVAEEARLNAMTEEEREAERAAKAARWERYRKGQAQ
jgi:hypothetical protein